MEWSGAERFLVFYSCVRVLEVTFIHIILTVFLMTVNEQDEEVNGWL